MSGINRTGAVGGMASVDRESPSNGHDGVARRQTGDGEPVPRNARVDEVAKLYEKQFLREMVRAMRGTVGHSELTKPSMGENIYRERLDQEYVETWGETGGIGLSDLIYEQIMERYFASEETAALKRQGPIALADRDVSRVSRMKADPHVASPQLPLRVELKEAADGTSTRLQAPWAGEILSLTKIGDRTAVGLRHERDFRSTLIFDGVPGAGIQTGRRIEKGHAVGVLSPDIRSFFWNLSRGGS